MVVASVLNDITGIVSVSLIFGGWVIYAVIASIAKNWRKVHESEHAAALKQSMIERGMSAEDIERVLRAGPPSESVEEKGSTDHSTELAGTLAEHKIEATYLGLILSDYRAADPSMRKELLGMIVHMLENGANGEQLVAAVRATSRPTRDQSSQPRFSDSPASFRN